MTQRVLTIAAVCILIGVIGPALVLAQDSTPGADALATAQAADRWANSARATAQAGYAQATAEAVQATEQARIEATATAAQATSQAMATQEAAQATSQALSVRATDQALNVAATREALQATATVQALQAQAVQGTAHALEAERSALGIKQSKEQGEYLTTALQIGLGVLFAVAFAVMWRALRWLKQGEIEPVASEVIDVIDAEPASGGNGRTWSSSKPIALIPAESGWMPAYLRPIEAHERQGRPA